MLHHCIQHMKKDLNDEQKKTIHFVIRFLNEHDIMLA